LGLIIRRDYVKLIIKGIERQTLLCTKHNLWCIDPPALTSGMIRSMYKMSDHAIENFWRYVEEYLVSKTPIEIFKINGIKVLITLQHMKTHVEFSKRYGIYLDELDCYVCRGGLECIKVPSTHVLKIYIIGIYNDELRFKLNAIYVLKILRKVEPKSFNELMKALRNIVDESFLYLGNLLKVVTTTINRHKGILTEILGPKITRMGLNNSNKLMHHSPILRKLLKLRIL